jgi:hypothetical protein
MHDLAAGHQFLSAAASFCPGKRVPAYPCAACGDDLASARHKGGNKRKNPPNRIGWAGILH